MISFSACLDACVIFPYSLSHTLLTAAKKDLYRVYFSTKILDEAIGNRVKRGRMEQVSADKFREALLDTFPEALVEVPADLEDKMENHFKDRHVLACAVYAKVNVIVTSNVKDFPASSLLPWNMEVMHPDDFLNYLSDEYGDDVMHDLLTEQINSYKKPPRTYLEFLSQFEAELPKFTNRMLNYAYNDMVERFARNVLITVLDTQDGERCLNGNRYKICENNNGIVITEKTTNREVIRSGDDEIIGSLKVKDIEIFEKVNKEVEVDKIPSRVRKSLILQNKPIET